MSLTGHHLLYLVLVSLPQVSQYALYVYGPQLLPIASRLLPHPEGLETTEMKGEFTS